MKFSLKQSLLVMLMFCLCVGIGANLAENWNDISWHVFWPANLPLHTSFYYAGFDGALLCVMIYLTSKCVLALRRSKV